MSRNSLGQTAEMLERRRRRQLQLSEPAWRILVRRATIVDHRVIDVSLIREESGKGEAKEATVRFIELVTKYAAESDMNVELQEREAGRSRFQPVRQAVGGRLLKW